MDKVTILMPTYNRADFFLPRAIKSVLNQTYTNWELVIHDDSSTDNTKEIITSFKDKRIKYTRIEKIRSEEKPESLSGNMKDLASAHWDVIAFFNRFLKESKSKYISILADDAMYYPTNLEKKVPVIKKGYAAVYGYAMNVLYKEGSFIPCGAGVRGQPFDKNMYMFGGTYFNFIDGSDILVDRVKALEVGGFKQGIAFNDYALIAKLCMRYEDAIGYVPEVLVENAIHLGRYGAVVSKDTKWRNSDSLKEHINIY